MPLWLPAFVPVNELHEKRGFLGVTCDELVLKQFLCSGPLCKDKTRWAHYMPASARTEKKFGDLRGSEDHFHSENSISKGQGLTAILMRNCHISRPDTQAPLTRGDRKNTYKSGVFVQTGFHKFLEGFAVVSLQSWRVVFGDQEENSHRMQVRIWRLSLCQFDGSNSKWPNICLEEKKSRLIVLSCPGDGDQSEWSVIEKGGPIVYLPPGTILLLCASEWQIFPYHKLPP